MHRSKSWRCGLVDQDLGRVASVNVERNIGGSGACQGAPHKERRLLGGEPCSTLTQDTSTWFCLSPCCQIGPVFSVPLRHQTSSHRRHGLGILHRDITAGYVMLTNTFRRAFCSCKCRIRPCICPLHAWWISRMTNFECVLCSCSSVQLPMSFFVHHESKQMAPEWVEAPFTTPSSC